MRESAEVEEISGFDASGSNRDDAAPQNGPESGNGDNDSGSGKSLPEWSSNTDDTSLSQGMSSLEYEDTSEAGLEARRAEETAYVGEMDSLDEEGKVSLLAGIFPSLTRFDVSWSLRKHKWNTNSAINDLLTQSFLEQSGYRIHGIEAFSETNLSSPRKGKGKKKKNRRTVESPSISRPESPSVNKWTSTKEDVDFISSRTAMPIDQVTSLYHKNGGSVRNTVSSIVDAHLTLGLDLNDPIIQSRAIDLGHEFPTIPTEKLEAIVTIAHPSTTCAHDLAKSLMVPPSNEPKIQIELRHSPLQLDPATVKTKPKSHNALYPEGMSLEEASAMAKKHQNIRDTSFQQARAAYRKGKSDHLMSGAAAYYSQQGRDADALTKQAQSAAAEALVNEQSTRFELDLHGVNVNDAKRIAKEKVTTWWHELGECRITGPGVGSTYRIVTGVGNHSEGGVGKLGPAVCKMLMRDGWKVEVGTGILIVMGWAKTK